MVNGWLFFVVYIALGEILNFRYNINPLGNAGTAIAQVMRPSALCDDVERWTMTLCKVIRLLRFEERERHRILGSFSCHCFHGVCTVGNCQPHICAISIFHWDCKSVGLLGLFSLKGLYDLCGVSEIRFKCT